MPPVHPPLKNDGPACRVCGCTEHNACLIDRRQPAIKRPRSWRPGTVTCSWVETSGNDLPRSLCSACSGTAADLAESLNRIQQAIVAIPTAPVTTRSIALTAIRRYKIRQELEKGA